MQLSQYVGKWGRTKWTTVYEPQWRVQILTQVPYSKPPQKMRVMPEQTPGSSQEMMTAMVKNNGKSESTGTLPSI